MLGLGIDRGLFRVGHPMLIAVDRVRVEGAVHDLVQLLQERVHLAVDLIAQVVAEIVFGAAREKRRRPRRVGIDLVVGAVDQADAGQGRHQGRDAVGGNAGFLGNLGRGFRPVGQHREHVHMQRREQRLRRHEAEGKF